jgi:hypothetical protein
MKTHEYAVAPDFYRFNNRWNGTVAGQRVTVFAGALTGDPRQGVLLIRRLPKDELHKSGRHVAGPVGAGSLRLVAWADHRVKVLAESGDSVWCDLSTGRIAGRMQIA